MRKILVTLLMICAQLGYACHCEEFRKVQKQALAENKFIIVHFSNHFTYESDDMSGNPMMNPIQENKDVQQLMQSFLYVCATDRLNVSLIKQYQVTSFPVALIIDANGKEIYRFRDVGDSAEFYTAITNFSQPSGLLPGDVNGYHQKKSYYSALRIAQKYFDYSLLLDKEMKGGVYNLGKTYIADAEQSLSVKEEGYAEKKQKLELIKLLHWAYEKNFSFLDQQLSVFNPESIRESNTNLYYFLRYITSKALQKEDFSLIEAKTKDLEGFDAFVKKADIILTV